MYSYLQECRHVDKDATVNNNDGDRLLEATRRGVISFHGVAARTPFLLCLHIHCHYWPCASPCRFGLMLAPLALA